LNYKVLFIGDIVGENGLKFYLDNISNITDEHKPDFTIVNGENIWQGKGLNEEHANALFKAGANVITTGNHIWENWKSRPLLATNSNVLRPLNYPSGNPGKGYTIVEKDNLKIGVIQLQGRTYMQTIDCPFKAAENALKSLEEKCDIIIVDFHAETTAEKMALAWQLDGKVNAIIGTHTHVQTNDARILPDGTAFLSDVGMTGPYDSVLGMRKDIAIKRFLLQTAHKFELAEDDFKIAYAIIQIDTVAKVSTKIQAGMFPKFINEASF